MGIFLCLFIGRLTEKFKCCLGRRLLCLALGAPFTVTDHIAVQHSAHLKDLGVLGSGFGNDLIM